MSLWMYHLVRWVLGTVFIYAGSTKLLEPEIFTVLIDAYGIVPEALLIPVAIALPILEVIAGIGLLFDIRGSLTMIAGLLVLFIVLLEYGLWIGLDVDCGCFGPEDPEAEAFHGFRIALYRDFAMLAGVIFIYSWRRYRAVKPADIMPVMNKLLKNKANGGCL